MFYAFYHFSNISFRNSNVAPEPYYVVSKLLDSSTSTRSKEPERKGQLKPVRHI